MSHLDVTVHFEMHSVVEACCVLVVEGSASCVALPFDVHSVPDFLGPNVYVILRRGAMLTNSSRLGSTKAIALAFFQLVYYERH